MGLRPASVQRLDCSLTVGMMECPARVAMRSPHSSSMFVGGFAHDLAVVVDGGGGRDVQGAVHVDSPGVADLLLHGQP